MTLLECLATVPDFRRKAGRRYRLSSVLTLCVLSVMSGYHSFREMHTFGIGNQQLLRQRPTVKILAAFPGDSFPREYSQDSHRN